MSARTDPRWWMILPFTALLLLVDLGRWPLWLDEIWCRSLMDLPLSRIPHAAGTDRHPPLAMLLMGLSWRLDASPTFMRLPSALAILGGVAVTGATLERFSSRRAAFYAVLLLTVCPPLLLHAHSARMYGLLFLWGAVLLSGALEAVKGRPALGAALLLLGTSGGLYTHYAAAVPIGAMSLGGILALLGPSSRPPDARRRLLLAGAAVILGGLSFLPWALGPLQYQLEHRDPATERSLQVMEYLLWAFDRRLPWSSWLWLALQALGAGLWLVRGGPLRGLLLGAAVVGTLGPWYFTGSYAGLFPRNYLPLLPLGVALAASALDTLHRRHPALALAPTLLLLALSLDPLGDLWRRPTSPQELGTGYDHGRTARLLDQQIPPDAPLSTDQPYLAGKYRSWAPGLEARTRLQAVESKQQAPEGGWRMISRGGKKVAGWPEACVFEAAFGDIVYAPPGGPCEALEAAIRAEGEAGGYPPFLLQAATHAILGGDWETARRQARMAAEASWWHPSGWLLLGQAELGAGQKEAAVAAYREAVAVTDTWRFPDGTRSGARLSLAKALEKNGGKDGGKEEARRWRDEAVCLKITGAERCDVETAKEADRQAKEAGKVGTAEGTATGGATAEGAGGPGAGSVAGRSAGPGGDAAVAGGAASPDAGAAVADGAGGGPGFTCPQSRCAPAEGAPNPVPATVTWRKAGTVSASPEGVRLEGPGALACSPPGTPGGVATARWRFEAGEDGSALILEARHRDTAGKVVGGEGGITRLAYATVPGEWRTDAFTWTVPAGTVTQEVCARLKPGAAATGGLGWVAVGG